eukprot:Blabericola_migrator_1__8080@NODE_415_length_8708_cov_199_498322_g327_i0_p7_GENE_NODE_415_length_8708_cov_199_498322_g327_i0NODE_415_length_8708_cov_199_498322_g327_i0_p7_ORF_typecomplete_len129_score14_45_NODE_415_length_8708_cov_199_498322_g327_i026713057
MSQRFYPLMSKHVRFAETTDVDFLDHLSKAHGSRRTVMRIRTPPKSILKKRLPVESTPPWLCGDIQLLYHSAERDVSFSEKRHRSSSRHRHHRRHRYDDRPLERLIFYEDFELSSTRDRRLTHRTKRH